VTPTRAALALTLVGALALTACGGDDDTEASAGSVAQAVIVGHTVDPLSRLLGEIYGQGMENSGVRVARKDAVADLDAVHAALDAGTLHFVPESTVSLLDRYGVEVPATVDEQLTAINGALPDGQSVQAITSAVVTKVVVCSPSAIDEFDLATISDLAAADGATLGGPASFESSPSFSLTDLNTAYEAEFDFTAIGDAIGDAVGTAIGDAVGDADADVAAAIVAGDVSCGVMSSLAPEITIDALLALDDDKAAAPQDAILPLLGTPATSPEATAVIGQINSLVTTDVLRALLVKMTVNGDSPEATAKAFLASQASS